MQCELHSVRSEPISSRTDIVTLKGVADGIFLGESYKVDFLQSNHFVELIKSRLHPRAEPCQNIKYQLPYSTARNKGYQYLQPSLGQISHEIENHAGKG
ncbi:hypothetical protein Mapa_001035 [Marchantia paleacea]|nr:hypothetical protein Mapa_001035 [Marchantia paleacea]